MSIRTAPTRLTVPLLNSLKPSSKLQDIADAVAPGLVLRVNVSGTKSWLFRFQWNGETPRIALGHFPTLGLAEARQIAQRYRQWLDQGIDPRRAEPRALRRNVHKVNLEDQPRPKRPRALEAPGAPVAPPAGIEESKKQAFADVLAQTPKDQIPKPAEGDRTSILFIAYEYLELWCRANGLVLDETARMLRVEVLPYWWWRDARSISPREIIERLDVIVKRGSKVAANRVAQVIGQMFKYAIHRSVLEDSPVKLMFKPGGKERPRKRCLREEELASYTANIGSVCRTRRRRHSLMILLLTLQRRKELSLAKWRHIDFERSVWHIPASNTKNRRDHVVPLSDWAKQEFLALKALTGNSEFVLPDKTNLRPQNPKIITRSVKRLLPRFEKVGIGAFKPHDLRRTGRTNLGRLKVPKDIAKRVLNHTQERLEETYDCWEYLDEKRDALNRYAEFLQGLHASDRQTPSSEAHARKKATAPSAVSRPHSLHPQSPAAAGGK